MPQGRYIIGKKGTHGCDGYPVVGDTGKVHGCHSTEASARQQQAAIYASEARQESNKVWEGSGFDPLAKRKFTTQQREHMAEGGTAMPDGSYPIANRKNLMNAIRSWGRGGAKPEVKAHIKRRAKALGAENLIPENWN